MNAPSAVQFGRQAEPRPPSAVKPGSAGNKSICCEILPEAEYFLWDSLVDRSIHGTVFHYSWWLAITAETFDILVVRDGNGQLLGGVPLPRRRRAGLTLLHAPSLTPFLGPIFDLTGINKTCDRLYAMRSLGEMLARNIKPFDSFRCMAGAGAPDLQGFLWAGFRAELAYTFRISRSQSLESVETEMTRTHSQKLAKARRLNVRVARNEGVDFFAALSRMASSRQGTSLFPESLPVRIWSAAFARGKGDFYIAHRQDHVPVAALLTVHDSQTTYQIVSAFDESNADVPGSYLLLWNALRDALQAGRDFDFEGSALRGVEQFYRRWGGTAVPIWRLQKAGSLRGALFLHLMDRREVFVLRKLFH